VLSNLERLKETGKDVVLTVALSRLNAAHIGIAADPLGDDPQCPLLAE
jgi:hypothetical protein